MANILAKSGYWADIQDALNQAQPGDNVFLPEGVFDFVNIGEDWTGSRVTYQAGINLFGAPTERDVNGQVVGWKTVLRLPWDVPGSWLGGTGTPPQQGGPKTPKWFRIIGNGDPNKPSRFSDIKLVGYRSIDNTSKMIIGGISIENVADFRVDHCYFEHMCGGGVPASGLSCRGVIDHCFLVNPVGQRGPGDWDTDTIGYGVMASRGMGDLWEDDISKVLGQYTNYTIFIEDCYFEKWRHCIAANSGAHYVIRHSTIKNDFGYGSLDAHGWGTMSGGVVTQVGTRTVEIYNCNIIDAIQYTHGTFIRGGAGVAFNNTVGGGTYRDFIYFSNEAQAEVSKCWINDWWIWNNTMLSGMTEIIKYDPLGNINEGINYFCYAPHTFSYQPYPYPHPLASGETPTPPLTTPFLCELEEGVYNVSVPPSIVNGSDTYNFKQWEDGSTNPVRTINLTSDMAITTTYEILAPPPPGYHHLTIVAYNGTTNPTAGIYEIAEGTTVQVTATPNTGYRFKHWLLDNVIAGLDPTITVAMDADHTLLAVCEPTPKFPVLQAGLGLLGVVGLVYLATRKG